MPTKAGNQARKKTKLPEVTILLVALPAAVAGGAEPRFDPAGQRIARPITFTTRRFTLRFSTEGEPMTAGMGE